MRSQWSTPTLERLTDYCAFEKKTRLAALYQQTKNDFSIYGILKRSSVQLSKLKSSALLEPKSFPAQQIEMWALPLRANTRVIDLLMATILLVSAEILGIFLSLVYLQQEYSCAKAFIYLLARAYVRACALRASARARRANREYFLLARTLLDTHTHPRVNLWLSAAILLIHAFIH